MFWEWICATTEVLFIFGQIGMFLILLGGSIYRLYELLLQFINGDISDFENIRTVSDNTSGKLFIEEFIHQNNKYSGDPTYSYMLGNPSYKNRY